MQINRIASTHRDPYRIGRVLGNPIGLLSILVLLIVLVGIAYMSYQYRVLPADYSLDFTGRWQGSQLVLHGQSPYGQAYFGRPFNYPAHITLVLLPMFLLPLNIALPLWMTLQIVFVAVSMVMWFKILELDYSPLMTGIIVLLCLVGWRYPMINYASANFVGFALFCLTMALWFYQKQQDVLAGLMLAMATIRPEAVVMVGALSFCMLYLRRWKVLVSLVATMILYLGVSFLAIGFWVPDFLNELNTYTTGIHTIWPITMVGPLWAQALLLTFMGIYAWSAYEIRGTDLYVMLSLSVLFALLVGPSTNPYVLTYLLIPLLVMLRNVKRSRYKYWLALITMPWWRPLVFPAWDGLSDLYVMPLLTMYLFGEE